MIEQVILTREEYLEIAKKAEYLEKEVGRLKLSLIQRTKRLLEVEKNNLKCMDKGERKQKFIKETCECCRKYDLFSEKNKTCKKLPFNTGEPILSEDGLNIMYRTCSDFVWR